MKLGDLATKATRVVLVVLALSCAIPSVGATTITFVATNLADVTPGEDLWRYSYAVSGRSFLQSEFFDIYFDPALYGMLIAGPAPNGEWDVLVLQQPAPGNLPPFDTGIFDSFALQDGPSLAGMFSVEFVYLGGGAPGSQPFEIYDASSALLETGVTTVPQVTAIPEPSTLPLAGSALAIGAYWFRRRRRTRHFSL